VIVATGYYDLANQLVCREKIYQGFHYYREPFPFFDTMWSSSGARIRAEVALDLWRHGARVTLCIAGRRSSEREVLGASRHRNRIQNDEIQAHFNSHVRGSPKTRNSGNAEGSGAPENDFVFALVGYHPDFDFLRSLASSFPLNNIARCAIRSRWRRTCPNLRCWGDRCRIAHQRNLHRKWPLHGRLIASI